MLGKRIRLAALIASGKRSDQCSQDGSTDNPWGNDDTEFEQVPNGIATKRRKEQATNAKVVQPHCISL